MNSSNTAQLRLSAPSTALDFDLDGPSLPLGMDGTALELVPPGADGLRACPDATCERVVDAQLRHHDRTCYFVHEPDISCALSNAMQW
jgi:hypothetical protein